MNNEKLRNGAIFNNGDIALITDLRDLGVLTDVYTTDIYALVLCTSGRASATISGHKFDFGPNDLFICMPNAIIEGGLLSVDFKSKCLCLSVDYILQIAPLLDNSWDARIVFENNPLISLSGEEASTFHLYYDLICSRLNSTPSKYLRNVISALIIAFFYDFRNTVERITEINPRPFTSREEHFKDFMRMLSTSYPKSRSVAYYAEQLCITPKYLSTICRDVCQESPSKIIERYVVKDIVHQLTHTNKSIKCISNELEFPNISFFGKYVRNSLGMSPKAVRDKFISEQTQ